MRLVLKRHAGADIRACEKAVREAVQQLPPGAHITMMNVHARYQNDLDFLFRQAHGYRERFGNPFAQFDLLDGIPEQSAVILCTLLCQSGCYEYAMEDRPSGTLAPPEPFARRAVAPLAQDYLKPAPIGIDSYAAREHPGGDGEGVAFALIERSFLLPHSDLPRITNVFGDPCLQAAAQPDHGTASLGILSSLDDECGTVGIVPGAVPRTAAAWPGESDVALAVIATAAALHRGGVVILNTQSADRMPSETNELVFRAIELAVHARRVVVENAGEGGVDLDHYPALNRESPHFRNSGALLVAASNDAARSRHTASNYGSRVDCYAWGGKVTTTYPTQGYAYASGASAATAIVGACAVSVQAMYKFRYGSAMDPGPLREILNHCGTPAASDTERIGKMPDLRAAVVAVRDRVPQSSTTA